MATGKGLPRSTEDLRERVETLEEGGGEAGPQGPEGPEGPQGPGGEDGADGFPTQTQWDDLVARVTALENAG